MSDYDYEYEGGYDDDEPYYGDDGSAEEAGNELVAELMVQEGERVGVTKLDDYAQALEVAEGLHANENWMRHLSGRPRAEAAIRAAVESHAPTGSEFEVMRRHLTRAQGRPR
jgi:hypothetical protein